MNKLSLSCLKSLVEFRPHGDWDFLTKLVLVWPEARVYYWKKQGFRTLLRSWPFVIRGQNNTFSSFLWLSGNKVFHGISISQPYDSPHLYVEFNDLGILLLVLCHRNLTPRNWDQWTQVNMLILIPFADPSVRPMKPKALVQLLKDRPWIKNKVMRALNIARALGQTKIRTLEKLASLIDKEIKPGQEMDSGPKIKE